MGTLKPRHATASKTPIKTIAMCDLGIGSTAPSSSTSRETHSIISRSKGNIASNLPRSGRFNPCVGSTLLTRRVMHPHIFVERIGPRRSIRMVRLCHYPAEKGLCSLTCWVVTYELGSVCCCVILSNLFNLLIRVLNISILAHLFQPLCHILSLLILDSVHIVEIMISFISFTWQCLLSNSIQLKVLHFICMCMAIPNK